MPNRDGNISDKQQRDNETKIRILRQAVQEGVDEIDRGEFILVEPNEIDNFVNKLAMKVMRSQSSRHGR
ncbi:MAG TPA: hypothetical protein VFW23_05240 [Tepidisphaeraceae bacterium]|nr:hypothetical protein [Tepidisphaeraceae bacterium]